MGIFPLLFNAFSQNHRMIWVVRDLWISSSAIPAQSRSNQIRLLRTVSG